jgi:hypothetical protein
LAATGVEIILAYVGEHPMQTHPLVPVVQVTADASVQTRYGADLDLYLSGDPAGWIDELLALTVRVLEHQVAPKLYQQGNIDFQLTRGLLGVTL